MGRRTVAAALLAVASLAAGCGSGRSPGGATTSTTASRSGGSTGAGGPGPKVGATTVPSTTTTVPVAHLGTPLTVTDAGADEVQVTVAKVVTAAKGLYAFAVPGPAMQYVGVQLNLSNVGPSVVRGSADTDTRISDTQGDAYSSVVVELPGCPSFSGGVFNLAAGASASGCVSFEVPISATVAAVKFGLGGALATNVGVWQVR